jgi:hypothetical protein
LRCPTPSFILQAGLLDSPEKSFFLLVYAEAMARALHQDDLLMHLVLAME